MCPERSEQTLAHRPVPTGHRRIAREGPVQDGALEIARGGGLKAREIIGIVGAELDEQCSILVANVVHPRRGAGDRASGPDREVVEELGGACTVPHQDGHRGCRTLQVGEVQEGGGMRASERNGAEGRVLDEAERALRPDEEPTQDAGWRIRVEESVQAVAIGVLDRELRPDPRAQHRI